MSDLAKLARKQKVVKIGEHEIAIKPIGVSDMDLFDKLEQENLPTPEVIKAVKNIIKKVVVGATDEELDDMSLEYMSELQMKILEIHNIDEEKMKDKMALIHKIKNERAGIAGKEERR